MVRFAGIKFARALGRAEASGLMNDNDVLYGLMMSRPKSADTAFAVLTSADSPRLSRHNPLHGLVRRNL